MTGFSSVSIFGSNERLASISEYAHDRQPAGQRFGYTLDRNADGARYDGHEHKRSEHGYRGTSFTAVNELLSTVMATIVLHRHLTMMMMI